MDPNKRPSLDGMTRHLPPRPPIEPASTVQPAVTPLATSQPELPPQPTAGPGPSKPKRRWWLIGIGIFFMTIAAIIVGAYVWYQQQMAPASQDADARVRITVASGMSPAAIGALLETSGAIKSKTAFSIHTKLTSTENALKAGTYSLRPNMGTAAIVDQLVAGTQATFTITFLPGDTLINNRSRILKAGYSQAETDAALQKTYDRPLFSGKPATSDLEGYIYGETYQFAEGASVEDILNRTFDEYEAVIAKNDLTAKFAAQKLSLFQGITLASIVQREAPNARDQQQIARVFLNRIAAGMTLGSDVTYQYIADKTGVARDVNLDSPYNTRRYAGLPPGPIASPGASALVGVANPAANDYLFFLSGDDDVTYFGRTDAEHQRNIIAHCQKKCLII